jgi:hypothetical protein
VNKRNWDCSWTNHRISCRGSWLPWGPSLQADQHRTDDDLRLLDQQQHLAVFDFDRKGSDVFRDRLQDRLAVRHVEPAPMQRALAAGNGFVLKPSELTPVTGLKIAEVFHEAGLPPGLLSVVPGPAAEIGATIFKDPRVA